MFRRPRRVRIHHVDSPRLTYEGIEHGRRPVAGFHVLVNPTLLEELDDGKIQSTKLATHVEIPADKVLFREVLGK